MIETERANADLLAVHRAMKDIALSRNPSQFNAALNDMNKYDAEINTHFAALLKMDADNPLLSDMIDAYTNWEPIRAKTIDFTKNGQYEAAAENTRTLGAVQVALIIDKMQLFVNYEKTNLEKTYQSSNDLSAKYFYGLILLALLETVLAICLSLYIRRKLLKYEAQLHEEREELQITFDSIGDGVITTDVHMNVQKLNMVAEELTGWKTKDAFGRPFTEVFKITNAINGEKAKDPIVEVLTTDKICTLENHTVLTSKDGIDRHIADSAAPIKDEYGKTTGVVMTFRDVTERKKAQDSIKESEEKYRSLFENSGAAICYCKPDGTIITLNNVAAEYLGLLGKNYVGSFLCEQFPESAATLCRERIKIAVSNEGSQQYEDLVPLAVGEKWLINTYSRITDGAGNILGIQIVAQDISQRKKGEEEIRYLSYHDVLTGLYNRAFYEEERKRLDTERQLPLSYIMGDINGLKLINDMLGHTKGDMMLSEIAKILTTCCRSEDIVARIGGDEFCILLPQTSNEITQTICRRIYQLCEEYEKDPDKEMYYLSISLGYATKTATSESFESIMRDAEELMYKRKLLERKSMHSSIISSIKTTMFEKSHETEEHAERLAELSMALGKVVGLSDNMLNDLVLLSELHDIGKIGINDSILLKPGRLTEDEWIQMKKHSEIGYRIAQASPELISIADYILCHHEHWDGSGYPQGLCRETIPLLSRILSIVDSYDAMTNNRPYRKAMPKEAAIAELINNAGTQFDPEITKLFVEKVLGEDWSSSTLWIQTD